MLATMSDPHTPASGHDPVPRHDHHQDHDHEHSHGSDSGVLSRLRHMLRPHSHDVGDQIDAAMETSKEGMRTLWISLAVLGVTALIQAAVVAVSGSVALLGDTGHHAADALTAGPLGIAFVACPPPPAPPSPSGDGPAADLPGVFLGVVI